MKRAVRTILGVGLMLAASLVYSAQHPVPLDKNTDPAKCIECHSDKSQGKFVHSAIATGCTSCHEIRNSKDGKITHVKLITSTPGALCLTCHSDKSSTELKGKVHPPAVRDCVKCHDPHTSENKNQLLKPASGDASTNLCLSCHKMGVDVPKGGSRHAALDMGCDTCHSVHKVGDPTRREFRYHLTKDAPGLCIDCHDVKDANLVKAHDGQPFATADCLSCHEPHQSKSPMLIQAFAHAPFQGGKDSCSTCHQAPKDGKIVLTQASGKELCLSCHSDKAEQIEKAKVQHPGAQGDCTDCHGPHAGKSPGFLKPDAVNVCLGCHSDQADQGKKRHLHQPAFEQGCFTCHEPHGGDNPKLLRAATPNALCLECHGPDRDPQKVESDHVVTIFDGKVKLPEDYFSKVEILPLKYGAGHPTEHHPVTDRMAADGKTVKLQINCLTCHQPHSSAQAGLLIGDQSNNMAFCSKCHNGLDITKVTGMTQ